MWTLLALVGCSETGIFSLRGEDDAGNNIGVGDNSAPSAPGVTISPANPKTDDDLVCELTTPSIHPEGAELTTWIGWERDGEPVKEGDFVTADQTAEGET